MITSLFGRHPLIASVALICLPFAFQIAMVSVAVPDDMWLVFVLSIWASLTTGALVLSLLCGVIARFLFRRNRSTCGNRGNWRSR